MPDGLGRPGCTSCSSISDCQCSMGKECWFRITVIRQTARAWQLATQHLQFTPSQSTSSTHSSSNTPAGHYTTCWFHMQPSTSRQSQTSTLSNTSSTISDSTACSSSLEWVRLASQCCRGGRWSRAVVLVGLCATARSCWQTWDGCMDGVASVSSTRAADGHTTLQMMQKS